MILAKINLKWEIYIYTIFLKTIFITEKYHLTTIINAIIKIKIIKIKFYFRQNGLDYINIITVQENKQTERKNNLLTYLIHWEFSKK